ncbi:hypothetical protein F5144DRAFT_379443 [Chaetomium tenue]|uniref:Uncharacterized protein n=1 Tax=Chaetomium tenue TaxID=1854479 RepID=A0ACB7NWC0_9PEZI|nr:hypothetical protein F5144DRAFT_379443 [Chaetomium globosum]
MLRPDYALDCPVAIAITDRSPFYAGDGIPRPGGEHCHPQRNRRRLVMRLSLSKIIWLGSGSGLAVSVPTDCVWVYGGRLDLLVCVAAMIEHPCDRRLCPRFCGVGNLVLVGKAHAVCCRRWNIVTEYRPERSSSSTNWWVRKLPMGVGDEMMMRWLLMLEPQVSIQGLGGAFHQSQSANRDANLRAPPRFPFSILERAPLQTDGDSNFGLVI